MRKLILLSVIFLSFFTTQAFAWWDMGHMAVGKIAYDRLNPKTKEQVDILVNYFTQFFPEGSEFDTCSCTPDDIKEGFKALNSWHISSFPYDSEGRLSEEEIQKLISKFDEHDARFAISQAIETLKNPKAHIWAKAFMLRYLIHCVGDIHQPLHCITLYNSQFPNGDRGGNDFHVKNTPNGTKNLHAFWDSICGLDHGRVKRPMDQKTLEEFNCLVKQIILENPPKCGTFLFNMDVNLWREESYDWAKTFAYENIKSGSTLSEDYITYAQTIAKMRIATAGYRLAYLLNSIFDK